MLEKGKEAKLSYLLLKEEASSIGTAWHKPWQLEAVH
jgi:hypothetical protein